MTPEASDDFDQYLASRWPRLVRSAILLGCNPPEAEDIVQSAMLKCFTRWSSVRKAHDRDAYVHRVLINTFVSTRRKKSASERLVPRLPEEPSRDEMADVDVSDAVMRCLNRLSPRHRAVIVLRYYSLLDEAQMASVLQVAPGTIKSRLSRALQALAIDPELSELRGT